MRTFDTVVHVLYKTLLQERGEALRNGGIFPPGATAPSGLGSPRYRGFLITLGHTAVVRTPLGEWSARRRDLST